MTWYDARLSPCGESGLKFICVAVWVICEVSLPMRGEWIEISLRRKYAIFKAVSPHAGRVD